MQNDQFLFDFSSFNSLKIQIQVLILKRILDHDNFETRDRLRAFLADPVFQPRNAILLDDERDLALERNGWVDVHKFCVYLN